MEDNSMLIQAIRKAQDEYISFYCKKSNEHNTVRYRDDELPGMYDYNCLYIKKMNNQQELYKAIKNEKKSRKENGYEFCRIFMEDKPDLQYFDKSYEDMEIEHNGMYVYKPMISLAWKTSSQYVIRKVENESGIRDLESMDITSNAKYCGREFCIERSRHHGKVFADDSKELDCYICYDNDIPVGHCELMIKDKTAKIEDFEVLEDYRHKGIGTTIMKNLIDIALKSGAEIIYLVADEDDTVKDMYTEMGFHKVCDEYAMLMKFEK